MAGLYKRYCRQTCACEPECEGVCTGSGEEPCTPFRHSDRIKGLCGCCQDSYYNCDENGEHCGKWQCEDSEERDCCDCSEYACGDGHDCPRYIDIEFDLDAFVIQGETCCNGANVPLTQQCAGGWQSEVPVVGTPPGWSSHPDGVTDFVIYEKTAHKIRLTRQDCGCYWGGYWSSECNCNTCCCDESCEEGSIYPDCDDCSHHNCFDQTCVDMPESDCLGSACRACDPSNSCGWRSDNGFASSQDDYGTGNIGGSDGQAICAQPSCRSDASCNNCGFVSTACDSWIDAPTSDPAFSCWNCGTFKPHHIQAYLTYTSVVQPDDPPNGQCNVAWVLEIRGLTEDVAAQFGNTNNWPFFDCPGAGGETDVCAFSYGGWASDKVGYRAKFQGRHSVCNTACDQSNDFSPVPEFIQHSCGCPPTTELESTIQVRGATACFHPAAVYAQAFNEAIPQMYPCVISDAQGTQPHESWCQNDAYLPAGPACTGIQKQTDGCFTKGTCHGPPLAWNDKCYYCTACCETDGVGHWDTACTGSCECGSEPDEWCSCAGPNFAFSNEGIPNQLYPCSHCAGGDESKNHATCNPCFPYPEHNIESHVCVPCRLVIRPNDSEVPAWAPDNT